MTKIAIRCHPWMATSPETVGDWLEQQVVDLRAIVPEATIRLSRLTQALPTRDLDVGWLIELELSQQERDAVNDRLLEAVRDMGLLGFQPTALESVELTEQVAAMHGGDREWW